MGHSFLGQPEVQEFLRSLHQMLRSSSKEYITYFCENYIFSAKAIGRNQFKFTCGGQKDLVELLSMEHNGEPVETTIINQKKDRISSECFKQTGEKIANGSQVR